MRAVAASIALLAAVTIGLVGVAAPVHAETPSPSPTSTAPANPYAEHDHQPGDEDSDPTWVWVFGGILFLLVGTGLVLNLVFIRRVSTERSE